jgi:hypothetical protein
VVPPDCTASNDAQLTRQALEQMRLVTQASVVDSGQLDFAALDGGQR